MRLAALILVAWANVACLGRAEMIRFLVTEYEPSPPHGDSYVVLIDDQDQPTITQARALVSWFESGADLTNAPDDRIVLVDIRPGADGINRDHVAVDAPAWSWHTTGTATFVGNTIEILDGWPSFVESDVAGWIDNTGGALGFWSYTVTQELGPVVPEPSGSLLLLVACCCAGACGALCRSCPVCKDRAFTG
jgi:hypothetical protein